MPQTLVDALESVIERERERERVTAFKYSAGAAAQTMPTYDDGSSNTLTADTHPPAICTFAQNARDELRVFGDGEHVGALSAQPGMKQQTYVCMADDNGRSAVDEDLCGSLKVGGCPDGLCASNGDDVVGTLCARDHKGVGSEFVSEGKVVCQRLGPSRSDAGPAHTSGTTGRSGPPGRGALVSEEQAFTVSAAQDQTLVGDGGTRYVVRRLTPLECERLQGFPDGWTDVEYRGRPASDAARYRAIGNSMTVPVMAWILGRVGASLGDGPGR